MESKYPRMMTEKEDEVIPVAKSVPMDAAFYAQIRVILGNARHKAYTVANFAMVEAYWEIGKRIAEQQDLEASHYGSGLIRNLSAQMTADSGKGFTATNLKYMRRFT